MSNNNLQKEEIALLEKAAHGDRKSIDSLRIKDSILKFVITPDVVVNVLKLFLANKVTDDDLNQWAKVLLMSDSFVHPNWESDSSADYYEDMWYVLQRISSPEIDGEINQASVKQYVSELESRYTMSQIKDMQ